MPYAGGSAAIFRSWAKHLASVDLYALGLPGRDSRLGDSPFTTLESLVVSAVDAMHLLAKRPYALFGHSMGALIAFETARLLRRRRAASPVHLFVSGFRAPHLPDPKPPYFDLPPEKFIDELRRISAPTFDPDAHPELVELMLPTLRADFQVVQTYRYCPEPPLACPLTAFGGLEDHEVNERQLQEWQHHTSASFSLKMLPGGHFFLHTAMPALLNELAIG